jgi:hypothetical protein
MSFRAWGPKQNKVYARSITAAQVNAVQPTDFAKGGNQVKVYNSGATDVLVAFWAHGDGDPTLVFPVDGAPPTGQGAGQPGQQKSGATATIVPKGVEKQISIPLSADSFGAVGSGAGPSIIYVQRGDGST